MLSREDERAINDLFDRLAHSAAGSPVPDTEAEDLIRERMRAIPGAEYYLAQAVVAQQHALGLAHDRIAELEDDHAARRPTPGRTPSTGGPANPGGPSTRGGPWDRQRSGFLEGAAQTAMGVAGGLLIGNLLADMFAGDPANAAEIAPEAPVEPPAPDLAADEGSDFGDFDDFGGFGGGGFDIGGDF